MTGPAPIGSGRPTRRHPHSKEASDERERPARPARAAGQRPCRAQGEGRRPRGRPRVPGSPDLHARQGGRARAPDHAPVPVRGVLAQAARQRGSLAGEAGYGPALAEDAPDIGEQEMLHLALVQNLLTAVGAAPRLAHPNFPMPAYSYPAGVRIELLPFGELPPPLRVPRATGRHGRRGCRGFRGHRAGRRAAARRE